MKVLITGATSGIGEQLALDYQKAGNEVWAVGRKTEKLEQLKMLGMHIEQLDLEDRHATIDRLGKLEQIDLAILSAGSCEYIDMPDFDSAMVARILRRNVESLANSIEGLLPPLRRSDSPHLVGIGSSAAYLPLPRAEAYGASKAAVEYLMKTLRITLAPEKITVSLVCPGFVKTPLTDLNEFPMPCRISTEEASVQIRKGIEKKKAEIHFPKRFTLALKLASLLPQSLWQKIAQRMVTT
jgi:short-subunit dehydrogenase